MQYRVNNKVFVNTKDYWGYFHVVKVEGRNITVAKDSAPSVTLTFDRDDQHLTKI